MIGKEVGVEICSWHYVCAPKVLLEVLLFNSIVEHKYSHRSAEGVRQTLLYNLVIFKLTLSHYNEKQLHN